MEGTAGGDGDIKSAKKKEKEKKREKKKKKARGGVGTGWVIWWVKKMWVKRIPVDWVILVKKIWVKDTDELDWVCACDEKLAYQGKKKGRKSCKF